MHIVDINGTDIINFTYEEEVSLAKTVMDCISFLWVRDEFQILLDTIYQLKCKIGSASNADNILELLGFLDYYNMNDLVPSFIDNEKSIWHELDHSGLYKEEKALEQRRSVIRAWREVWDGHEGIKRTADTYKTFPGDLRREDRIEDLDLYIKEQHVLEEKFWNAVDAIMEEFNHRCSRSEAMAMASDTNIRGDFSMIKNT